MNMEKILYEVRDSLAIITLNDPRSLNAFSYPLVYELSLALDKAEKEPEVKVVIITGGEKVFAAGGDVPGMLEMDSFEAGHYSKTVQQIFNKIEFLSKPVIAMIAGPAIGGGCELALACDLRLASSNARFGQPEVDLGVVPGAGATVRLSRLVGPALAKEMIFTGRIIDATTAQQIGLVNQVVEPAELWPVAKKLALKIANKAPMAIRLAKEAINVAMNSDFLTATQFESRGFALTFSTVDKNEGMKAFLDKRKPVFQGK
ncbi:MAG: hypothetical protein GX295_11195 [Syntrophomonadaceae bacterium]|nr:hypothetical protein [Syntrophomonadaceae bacterium]